MVSIDGTRSIVILGFFVEFWAHFLSFFTNFTRFALFFLFFLSFAPFCSIFCLFFVGGPLLVTSEGRRGRRGVVGGLQGVVCGLTVAGDSRGVVCGLAAVGFGWGEVR